MMEKEKYVRDTIAWIEKFREFVSDVGTGPNRGIPAFATNGLLESLDECLECLRDEGVSMTDRAEFAAMFINGMPSLAV